METKYRALRNTKLALAVAAIGAVTAFGSFFRPSIALAEEKCSVSRVKGKGFDEYGVKEEDGEYKVRLGKSGKMAVIPVSFVANLSPQDKGPAILSNLKKAEKENKGKPWACVAFDGAGTNDSAPAGKPPVREIPDTTDKSQAEPKTAQAKKSSTRVKEPEEALPEIKVPDIRVPEEPVRDIRREKGWQVMKVAQKPSEQAAITNNGRPWGTDAADSLPKALGKNIANLFERAMKKDPSVGGKVIVHMYVDKSGYVSKVGYKGEHASEELVEMFTKLFGRVRFIRSQSGFSIEFPLILRQNGN